MIVLIGSTLEVRREVRNLEDRGIFVKALKEKKQLEDGSFIMKFTFENQYADMEEIYTGNKMNLAKRISEINNIPKTRIYNNIKGLFGRELNAKIAELTDRLVIFTVGTDLSDSKLYLVK